MSDKDTAEKLERAARKRVDIAKRAAGGDPAVALAALEQQMQHWNDLRALIKHVPRTLRVEDIGIELWDACVILERELGQE